MNTRRKFIRRHLRTSVAASLLALAIGIAPVAYAEETIDTNENPLTYNEITITDDTVTANGRTESYGGGSYSYNVRPGSNTATIAYNTINMNGGNFTINFSEGTNYGGNIIGNSFNINGGTLNYGYVSLANGSTATGNILTITGSPNLNNAYLYGGIFGDVATASDNTLNVNTKGVSAQNIMDFQTLNFFLPSDTTTSDVALNLSASNTDIAGAYVNAAVHGDANLNIGDTVTLLQNAGTLNADGISSSGVFGEGVTLNYGMNVSASGGNSLVGTITTLPSVLEQTRALNQPLAEGFSQISAGTERIIEWLPPEDIAVDAQNEANGQSSENESSDGGDGSDSGDGNMSSSVIESAKTLGANGFEMFANMGGGSMRTKTGNGSYIDSNSGGLDLGFAHSVENRYGRLIFGPLIDYGKGKFDTYLANGIKGHGDSNYWSAGMIARQTNHNGFYYEASLRGGKVNANFRSNDFLINDTPVSVGYDMESTCWAGHIRVGQVWNLDRINQLHVYGFYTLSRQGSMTPHISTGETYNFSSADSGRLRIGTRLTRRVRKYSRFYSGIAYQYEMNGEAGATYKDYQTPKITMKGSSGMLELGWQVKPVERSVFIIDVGAVGWIGHQKGVTFQAKLKRDF